MAMDAGMAFLTEDRKESGCFLLLDIMANMQMALLRDGYATAGFVKEREIEALCQQQKNHLRIRTPTLKSRWATSRAATSRRWPWPAGWRPSRRCSSSTSRRRAIDVGAKAEIHRLMSELAGAGSPS